MDLSQHFPNGSARDHRGQVLSDQRGTHRRFQGRFCCRISSSRSITAQYQQSRATVSAVCVNRDRPPQICTSWSICSPKLNEAKWLTLCYLHRFQWAREATLCELKTHSRNHIRSQLRILPPLGVQRGNSSIGFSHRCPNCHPLIASSRVILVHKL